MAKDNFWKNPAVIQALLGLSNRYQDDSNAKSQLTIGELLKSQKTRNMLKPAGVKYPSQLDIETVRRANNEWWNPFDDNTYNQWIYATNANNWGTIDSFKNRLIGMTKNDSKLNEIIFNEDGSINEANLDRIARVAYTKLGKGSWYDFLNQDPKYYYITPGMSEDKARAYAEGLEDLLGDTEDYKNYSINGSGALLAAKDRIDREYLNRSKQQDMSKLLEAAKAGSLANNDVEATIGGDPVNMLPSYVQESYKKTSEDEMEEELFKRRTEDDEKWKQIRARARKRYDENKKDKEWWWL